MNETQEISDLNSLIDETIELYNLTLKNNVTKISLLKSRVDVNYFKKYILEGNISEALSILESYSFLKDQKKELGGENNPNYEKLLNQFELLKTYVNELNKVK